jgi:hypothetical protein
MMSLTLLRNNKKLKLRGCSEMKNFKDFFTGGTGYETGTEIITNEELALKIEDQTTGIKSYVENVVGRSDHRYEKGFKLVFGEIEKLREEMKSINGPKAVVKGIEDKEKADEKKLMLRESLLILNTLIARFGDKKAKDFYVKVKDNKLPIMTEAGVRYYEGIAEAVNKLATALEVNREKIVNKMYAPFFRQIGVKRYKRESIRIGDKSSTLMYTTIIIRGHGKPFVEYLVNEVEGEIKAIEKEYESEATASA